MSQLTDKKRKDLRSGFGPGLEKNLVLKSDTQVVPLTMISENTTKGSTA